MYHYCPICNEGYREYLARQLHRERVLNERERRIANTLIAAGTLGPILVIGYYLADWLAH